MGRFLALCAGAALSVAVAASGCGDIYNPGPESGGSKGTEIQSNGAMGQPVTGSASQESGSTGPPNYMPITPTTPLPTAARPSTQVSTNKCRPSSPRWPGRGLGRGPRGWRPRH